MLFITSFNFITSELIVKLISPLPNILIIGSEYILPGFVTLPSAVISITSLSTSYLKCLQLKTITNFEIYFSTCVKSIALTT